jgi:hypothetical protein
MVLGDGDGDGDYPRGSPLTQVLAGLRNSGSRARYIFWQHPDFTSVLVVFSPVAVIYFRFNSFHR